MMRAYVVLFTLLALNVGARSVERVDGESAALQAPAKRILATIQPDDVVAKVGDNEVRYKEIAPTVALILHPVLAKAETQAERQAIEDQRENLTRQVIQQAVQTKLLMTEFERTMPTEIRNDSKKRAEADAKLQRNIRAAFDGELRSAREKIAGAPQAEIDKLLRQQPIIVRLALLMKERRLESDEELDAVLRELNTSLEEQIKSYGEYMLSIEAARSKLRNSPDKAEAQGRFLETLRARTTVWTIYDNE